jgi:hypothetical protein
MATSNNNRSRERCPRQGQLWTDQTQKSSPLSTPDSQEIVESPEGPREWVLDDTTKARGRRGLAQVRQALAHSEPQQLDLFGRGAPSHN